MTGKRNERPARTKGPSKTTSYRTDTRHLRATPIDQRPGAKYDDQHRLIVEPGLAHDAGNGAA